MNVALYVRAKRGRTFTHAGILEAGPALPAALAALKSKYAEVSVVALAPDLTGAIDPLPARIPKRDMEPFVRWHLRAAAGQARNQAYNVVSSASLKVGTEFECGLELGLAHAIQQHLQDSGWDSTIEGAGGTVLAATEPGSQAYVVRVTSRITSGHLAAAAMGDSF